MKHPALWSKTDLHKHLQQALDLEVWTIPLYLTALYSIKDLKKLKTSDYPDAAKLLFSVAVQEMLHIELVCNISNALGYSVKFKTPSYHDMNAIPFFHPHKDLLPDNIKGYPVLPNALSEGTLKLFCAIELPLPKKEIEWSKQKACGSIAEVYDALKIGIISLWDQCYVGHSKNIKQKNCFHEYHNKDGRSHGFSQKVDSPETAMLAIEAIIEQGEGANSKLVAADFRPPKPEAGKEYDSSWFKGHLSHYQKFRIMLHSYHKLPAVYSGEHTNEKIEQQKELDLVFSDFLKELEVCFNAPGPDLPETFWQQMSGVKDAITAVWESGKCPHFGL
jgi:hypothetical protein